MPTEFSEVVSIDYVTRISMHECLVGQGCIRLLDSQGHPAVQYMLDATNRSLEGGSVILEWQPSSFQTERLKLSALAFSGCLDECSVEYSLGNVEGTSPLKLDLAAPGPLPQDLTIGIRMERPKTTAPVQGSLGQDVRLSGSVTLTGFA